MPRIFDNIDLPFLPALEEILKTSTRADFCVGYFNLRGWNRLGQVVDERFEGGEQSKCRLLVGMPTLPDDEIRQAYSLAKEGPIDAARALQLKRRMAEQFRAQLTIGAPTDQDEWNLQRLARQLRSGKVVVKLFLKNSLHAKLYLVHRDDVAAPTVGYVGSSNLTFAGLMKQFELNVDVVEGDAANKLAKWFEERWNDPWCLDITEELAKIIEASWARPTPIPPCHIYLKIAYHLAQEARAGLSEFRIPKDFGHKLFQYQVEAVKIAAHHLNHDVRRGVLLGDVVGLGKTLMATALARIFEDDHGLETLILCPKNLVTMWEGYVHEYRLRAKVLSITRALAELPEMRRYRIVILDESHNLRNREGKRFKAIQEYIAQNECRCILLSATPYNKAYLDLASQLRIFIDEKQDLGIRPDRYVRDIGEVQFQAWHQCPVRSLAAFEKTPHPDDWRDLMRLFMVRRTRSFIKDHYAVLDPERDRKYLLMANGERSYFPDRIPRTVRFKFDETDRDDPYARLYNQAVVDRVNRLDLPRYGLGNYIANNPHEPPTLAEAEVIKDLSRAGKRLMGFCRTNLFKRLESGGLAFIQSLERHVLRNYVFLYAIREGLPLPIGTTDAAMLDAQLYDADADDPSVTRDIFEEDGEDAPPTTGRVPVCTPEAFAARAKEIYDFYHAQANKRFRWLRPGLFQSTLEQDLARDSESICDILANHGTWDATKDRKLEALYELLTETHPNEKIIVFSQYADTVAYLVDELKKRGLTKLEGVTGQSGNPTDVVHRFSPISNEKPGGGDLRVVIATDVLSEGQNLQDAHVVVSFDLPWAIIRLIQRAGRVDRIGQKHDQIFVYSFYPMDGVEKVIHLRERVRQRLTENAEVVGADEQFFEDLQVDQRYRDLYNEKAGILDGDGDNEVDIASQALQIWKEATDADPHLKATIEDLPDVVFSAKDHAPEPEKPAGALVYMRNTDDTDALAWVDPMGDLISQSPVAILRAAACEPDTPAARRAPNHHDIVQAGVERMSQEGTTVGGQLGRASSARNKAYNRLKDYAEEVKGTLLETQELLRVVEEIYRYPLRQAAADAINRQTKAGISNEALAELCIALRSEDRLCFVSEEPELKEPRIICSLGLVGEVGP